MRLLTGFVVVAFTVVWFKVSWLDNSLAPISVEQAGVVLGVLGIKAVQKSKENPNRSLDTQTIAR